MMADLKRWNPFEELRRLADEFDRRLSSWSHSGSNDLTSTREMASEDDAWRIRVPLPGIDPKNVQINVSGRTLSLAAEQQERDSVARYREVVTLPDDVDLDKISARFRHGLLELTLPKSEAAKPRRIEIASDEPKQLSSAA